jgi:hypothetical protein
VTQHDDARTYGQGATPPPMAASPPGAVPPSTAAPTAGGPPAGASRGGAGPQDARGDDAARKAEQVRDEAREVGHDAKEEAAHVAHAAAEEARDLARDMRQELMVQARQQTERAGQGLRQLGSQLRALRAGDKERAGQVEKYAAEAQVRIDRMARRIEERGFDGVMADVRSFARRRPGTFLLGAAAAGFVTGRVLRGSADEARKESGNGRYGPAGSPGYPHDVPLVSGGTGVHGDPVATPGPPLGADPYPAVAVGPAPAGLRDAPSPGTGMGGGR